MYELSFNPIKLVTIYIIYIQKNRIHAHMCSFWDINFHEKLIVEQIEIIYHLLIISGGVKGVRILIRLLMMCQVLFELF